MCHTFRPLRSACTTSTLDIYLRRVLVRALAELLEQRLVRLVQRVVLLRLLLELRVARAVVPGARVELAVDVPAQAP